MKRSHLRLVAIAAAAIAVTGCSSYGSRGYSGVSVGYSNGYYGRSYYRPYYGWYDGYYYPGTGYYVYDRQGSRHRWSDGHRRYWESHRGRGDHRDNWSGYRRGHDHDRDGDHDRWRRGGHDRDGHRDRSRRR